MYCPSLVATGMKFATVVVCSGWHSTVDEPQSPVTQEKLPSGLETQRVRPHNLNGERGSVTETVFASPGLMERSISVLENSGEGGFNSNTGHMVLRHEFAILRMVVEVVHENRRKHVIANFKRRNLVAIKEKELETNREKLDLQSWYVSAVLVCLMKVLLLVCL